MSIPTGNNAEVVFLKVVHEPAERINLGYFPNGEFTVQAVGMPEMSVPVMLRKTASEMEKRIIATPLTSSAVTPATPPIQYVHLWEERMTKQGIPLVVCGIVPQDDGALLVRDWSASSEGLKYLYGDTSRWAVEVVKQVVENEAQHEKNGYTHGVAEWFGKGIGKKGLVIGSAPSLDTVLPFLRNQGKFPENVISVGINGAIRHLPFLPDFFFTLDWKGNWDWYEGWDTKAINFIASTYIPPDVLARFDKDKTYFFEHAYQPLCVDRPRHPELGTLDAGFTGTFSAIHFLYEMGCRDIALVGQDFAFTNAQNHIYEPLTFDVALAQQTFMCKDKLGRATFTTPVMVCSRDLILGIQHWFNKHKKARLVNCSSHGILETTVQMLLPQWLESSFNGA